MMERRTFDEQGLTKAQQYLRAQHSALEGLVDFGLPPSDGPTPPVAADADRTADCFARAFEGLLASELAGEPFTQAMDAVDALAGAPQPTAADGAWASLRRHAPQVADELATCLQTTPVR